MKTSSPASVVVGQVCLKQLFRMFSQTRRQDVLHIKQSPLATLHPESRDCHNFLEDQGFEITFLTIGICHRKEVRLVSIH